MKARDRSWDGEGMSRRALSGAEGRTLRARYLRACYLREENKQKEDAWPL